MLRTANEVAQPCIDCLDARPVSIPRRHPPRVAVETWRAWNANLAATRQETNDYHGCRRTGQMELLQQRDDLLFSHIRVLAVAYIVGADEDNEGVGL